MILAFSECKTSKDFEAVLRMSDISLLLDSSTKAQYFIQLCRSRCEPLASLSVKSLATIICGLYKHTSNQRVAKFLQECFCAKAGRGCTTLKLEVDQLVSLYDLLYYGIQHKKIREDILTHFETQANALKASANFAVPVKFISYVWLSPFSPTVSVVDLVFVFWFCRDIDDTVCSAVSDSRFPQYTVYPGARQFAAEVLGASSRKRDAKYMALSDWDKYAMSIQQRQVFLTDRPEALKSQVTDLLRQCGFARTTVLTGNVMNIFGAKWVTLSKVEHMKCLTRVFGEFQFVFVGDNGQGDIELGKELLRDPEVYPVAEVLIHDVKGGNQHAHDRSSSSSSSTSNSSSHNSQHPYRHSECEDFGLHVFQTYVTAAFQLYTTGILSVEAVGRIIRSTISDLASIQFDTELQKRSMAKQVMMDISFIVDKLPTNKDAMVMLEGFHERKEALTTTHRLALQPMISAEDMV
ncbi:hypothetical protein FI667_g4683, partial [Globisporangium splendens]